MIPHIQTHVAGFKTWDDANTGDAIPGNCVQASLASLLDLQLEQVPHFALFGNRWGGALVFWMAERGKRLHVFSDSTADVEYWEYWGVPVHPLNYAPNAQMMIATGPSHTGPWSHVVVWKAGELVHDPHPSQRGLAGPPTELWQVLDA